MTKITPALEQDDQTVIFDEDKKKERKKKAISDHYYAIPEDELQEIILRAKNGSQRDQEELLKIFNIFIIMI